MAPAIGIDLGTTYSCVAVFQHGKVEVIANEQANRKTPSFVAFTDTERLVGDSAKKQAAKNPVNTIFDVKRLIGGRVNDPTTREDMKHWPFQVGRQHGRPMLKVKFKKEEKTFAPEEISAMVLVKMKETAEAFLGTEVKDAVITVPAYFNDSQRQATKDAGAIAGLNVLRIINEPSAAALAFGLQKDLKGERNVLVYDLGGGTFDATVLTITKGSDFKVKATSGDTHLGGEDFDRRIVNFLAQRFSEVNHKDLHGNPRAMRYLRNAAEEAKRDLSMNTVSYIEIYALFEGIDFSTKLTRSWFEDLCLDLFKRTLEHVKKVLSDAKMDKDSIDDVVLVGGSTRIPKVQELLREFFTGKKLNLSMNPDEAVACGAAIQAAILSGDTSPAIQDMKLVDVAPFSLGLDMSSSRNMYKLVNKNTEVPFKKAMRVNLVAIAQNNWYFGLFEGENVLSDDNHFLGVFDVYGVPSVPPCNAEIEVTFDLDINGILTVNVDGRSTRARYEIVIKGGKSNRVDAGAISEMRSAAERCKLETKIELSRLNAQNNFQSLVYKLQTALSIDGLKKINENDRKKVNALCEGALEWLDTNQEATLEEYEGKKMELVSQTEGVFGCT